jgi:hypothetical protein
LIFVEEPFDQVPRAIQIRLKHRGPANALNLLPLHGGIRDIAGLLLVWPRRE